jgi:hypothetical protein
MTGESGYIAYLEGTQDRGRKRTFDYWEPLRAISLLSAALALDAPESMLRRIAACRSHRADGPWNAVDIRTLLRTECDETAPLERLMEWYLFVYYRLKRTSVTERACALVSAAADPSDEECTRYVVVMLMLHALEFSHQCSLLSDQIDTEAFAQISAPFAAAPTSSKLYDRLLDATRRWSAPKEASGRWRDFHAHRAAIADLVSRERDVPVYGDDVVRASVPCLEYIGGLLDGELLVLLSLPGMRMRVGETVLYVRTRTVVIAMAAGGTRVVDARELAAIAGRADRAFYFMPPHESPPCKLQAALRSRGAITITDGLLRLGGVRVHEAMRVTPQLRPCALL